MPTHTITIIFPVSLPRNLLPHLPSPQYVSHLQCVIACSPPLLDAERKRAHIRSELCWFGIVVAFLIIRRTMLPSCQKRQLNVWQLQGVWDKDSAQWAICPASFCLPLYTTHLKIVYTSDQLCLAHIPAWQVLHTVHMCEQICYIYTYILIPHAHMLL